jgi:cephalosporin-C deacetylase-like acetyl esterase
MKRFILLTALLALGVLPLRAQDATPEATPAPELPQEVTQLFDYKQDAPLDVKEVGSEKRGDVTVKDITYASPVTGKAIPAYLVLPPGEGKHPGVLYVHWYEPSAPTSNRTEFLDEAVNFAKSDGVVSLLVATMWSEPTWYQKGRSLDTDYDDAIHQVIELRRGLDVLLAQPEVDADRVAYVGHDFGAMYGSLLSAVDHRAKAFVFIAGASDFNNWMLFGVKKDKATIDAYKAKMEPLAPTHFVAHAAPAAILFQFGTEDGYTPAEDIDAFYNAASEPKSIKQYKSDHPMELPEIRADRLAFLREQLGLGK